MRHPGAILLQVTDTSINPLAAHVILPALGFGVQLSPEGRVLVVNVPEGLYAVQARHAGHASESRLIRVANDTVRIDFVLAPARGKRSGRHAAEGGGFAHARLLYFLGRSTAMAAGSFLTRGEIKRRRARDLGGLLRRVRDVKVERPARGPTIVRSTDAPGAGCDAGMLVFLDGVEIPRPDGSPSGLEAAAEQRPLAEPPDRASHRPDGGSAQRAASLALRWVGPSGGDFVRVAHGGNSQPEKAIASDSRIADIDRVPMSSVVAIEVYPSLAGVPPEFLVPGAECGVVLIWTTEA